MKRIRRMYSFMFAMVMLSLAAHATQTISDNLYVTGQTNIAGRLFVGNIGWANSQLAVSDNFRIIGSVPQFIFGDSDNSVNPNDCGLFQFNDDNFGYRLWTAARGYVNIFTIDPNGNFGLGNMVPTERLDVAGNIKVAGNYSGTGNIVTTAGKIGIGTASPTTALHVVGETTTNVINITGGSDLAEQFQVSNDVKPGTVVCIDAEHPGQLKASTKAYDKTVAGVISGAGGLQTGMKMGQQGSIADGSHPVALSGRVYCNVDATKGAVRPGDLLTTSNTPGCAMVVKDHAKAQGAVIGKAMTSLKAGQKGLVLVLISLQ